MISAWTQKDGIYASYRTNGVLSTRRIGDAQYVAFVRDANALRGDTAIIDRTVDFPGWTKLTFSDYDSRKSCLERNPGILFEGDVSPVRRFMADHKCVLDRPLRAYWDIETNPEVAFSEKENTRLLCSVLRGEDGRVFKHVLEDDCDEAEAELWEAVEESLSNYDQVAAWNGDGFDFEVRKARIERLMRYRKFDKFWDNRRRLLFVDQMAAYKRFNTASESGDEKTSMAIGAVSKSLLGDQGGKTEDFHAKDGMKAWRAGGAERQKLLDYCARDVDLMPMIEAKTGHLEVFQTLCSLTTALPNSHGLKPIAQFDAMLLRKAHLAKTHLPSKIDRTVKPYEGAFVMKSSVKGLERTVHVCDFASLYPSVIRTWNMGWDMKVAEGGCIAPRTNVRFSTEVESMLAGVIRECMELRKVWKKKKAAATPGTEEWKAADRTSTSYKVFVNSGYGVIGSPYSRFYDQEIVESVTLGGQFLIKATIVEVEARGWRAVYGDTDSVFVTGCTVEEFAAFVKWCNAELYPRLLAELGCNPKFACVGLSYEKCFDMLIVPQGKDGQPAGKRYCNPPECPIWMGDLTFKSLGDVVVGDVVVGWTKGVQGGNIGKRTLGKSTVVAVHRHTAPIVKVTMASGRTLRCTSDHRWLSYMTRSSSEYVTPKVGRKLAHVIDIPRELSHAEAMLASWLGGIFDGEGCLAGKTRAQIVITQSPRVNPMVCERIVKAFEVLGLEYGYHAEKKLEIDGCLRYALRGGAQARLNFLTWCRPAKAFRIEPGVLGSRFALPDEIVSIEPDGEGEVIGLTTTTGNYVAWGYASKNCGSYLHYEGSPGQPICPPGTVFNDKIYSKPEIKGLEYKRSDSIRFARRMQEECILKILSGTTDPTVLEEWVIAKRDQVMRGNFDLADIVTTKGISQSLDKYKAKGPHVRVAEEMEAEGEDVSEGTRIPYIVSNGAVSPAEVIHASKYDGKNADLHFYWMSSIYPATLRVLAGAFPNRNWRRWLGKRPKPTLPGQMSLLGLT